MPSRLESNWFNYWSHRVILLEDEVRGPGHFPHHTRSAATKASTDFRPPTTNYPTVDHCPFGPGQVPSDFRGAGGSQRIVALSADRKSQIKTKYSHDRCSWQQILIEFENAMKRVWAGARIESNRNEAGIVSNRLFSGKLVPEYAFRITIVNKFMSTSAGEPSLWSYQIEMLAAALRRN